MPAILEGTCSPVDKRGLVLLGDDLLGQEMLSCPWVREKGIVDLDNLRNYLREHCPESETEAKHSIQAEQETSYRDWYEWRGRRSKNGYCDGHWGTKWNALCCAPVNGATDTQALIAFSTAWSPPRPVIVELSKTFPKLTFTLKYWGMRLWVSRNPTRKQGESFGMRPMTIVGQGVVRPIRRP